MMCSRRRALATLGGLPLVSLTESVSGRSPTAPRLPAKEDFRVTGVYLNAAFVHPLSLAVAQALRSYADVRASDMARSWTPGQARADAVSAFARLINAEPNDVAVVPSTMVGENMLLASLGVGADRGVVTDAFHYHYSLVLYGEMRRRGVPVSVVVPRDNRIALSDIERAIGPRTKLIALSLVSSTTGFVHNLREICDLAHSRGVLVYADVIQAVGAVPLDVQATGVDFCCAGGYKWLQGDFGAAYLYVRPQALASLERTQMGWRQVAEYRPYDSSGNSPADPLGEWSMKPTTAAGIFEVASPAQAALWSHRASISYVMSLGVDAIATHRRPLMERLHAHLPRRGYVSVTPPEQSSPMAVFRVPGDAEALEKRLKARGVSVSFSANLMRIAPSVYNDMDDIEALLDVLH